MTFLYNTAIHILKASMHIAAIFSAKADDGLRGRKKWRETLQKSISSLGEGYQEIAWFHASSLGEFEQGRPLIEKLRVLKPEVKILLTFFSPSGYNIRKDYQGADIVCYLPFDTATAARDFLMIVRPSLAVFIKYEFWGNFIQYCHRMDIPLYLVSAIFRPSQVFFKPWGDDMRALLKSFSRIFVQDQNSLKLLDSIGVDNVITAGDTRFDRVLDILTSDCSLSFVERFKDSEKLVVAGSTWIDDQRILSSIIAQDKSNTKYIIAPHNIIKSQIDMFSSSLNVPYVLYSDMQGKDICKYKVLILDTIGILTKVYSYADVAYVGGGFTSSGVHNTLEPAVFATPIICGPNIKKYDEVIRMKQIGGLYTIKNPTEAQKILQDLLDDNALRVESGEKNGSFVQSGRGASDIILRELMNVISD